MGIDWNDNTVNVTGLLTSPDPIERIKGKIYHIIRNDPANTKSGDQLLLEMAQSHIHEAVQEHINHRFFGKLINQETMEELKRSVKEKVGEFLSVYPDTVTVHTDFTNPSNISVTLLLK